MGLMSQIQLELLDPRTQEPKWVLWLFTHYGTEGSLVCVEETEFSLAGRRSKAVSPGVWSPWSFVCVPDSSLSR